MSSGERPIGAAKGKQSDTEALCQPPPPPRPLQLVAMEDPSRLNCSRLGESQQAENNTPPPECCMYLTLTGPEPTGVFNPRPRQSPTKCGQMGPAIQAAQGGSDR